MNLMLNHVNTHLPLRERTKVAIRQHKNKDRLVKLSEEDQVRWWRHINRAQHILRNRVNYAKLANIDLEWFDKVYSEVFGERWWERTPSTTDNAIKTLWNLKKQIETELVIAERLLPPVIEPTDGEIDAAVNSHLKK